MRAFSFYIVSLFIMNCCYSQISYSTNVSDTIVKRHLNKDSLICINYRMLPELAKYGPRFKILNNVNADTRPIDINHSLQDFLRTTNFNDSSLLKSFILVNENMKNGKELYSELTSYGTITEKALFYGVWRNQLTKSSSNDEIRQSIINGTNTLIDLGYSDLGNDFLPFITALMEEQHLVNYDFSRTKAFTKGSRGIVTSVEILNALGSQDSRIKAGVCRDVHEMGRELLKTMCEVYYNHFYPGKNIEIDDYLFLQSWTTQGSQHVTISFINPLNTKAVYELDWGRVMEKTNITNYNNGRLYGNTFRIWQYNKATQRSEPVDFKRTQFGKILDEDILTSGEYRQFNGIYDEEFYSNIRYIYSLGRNGNINFSLGEYYPEQRYFLASYYLQTKKKKIFTFLDHSNTIALQAVIHEDTKKKQLLYPQTDWQLATSLMGIPRVISKFETPRFNLTRNITFDAFLNQQLDVFLITSSFQINDSTDIKEKYKSGDANLSFSNGLNIEYKSDNKSFTSSLTIQSRSCLLPKDVRLLSPNPFVLLPNIRFITPAVDAISSTVYNFSEKFKLSIDGLFEFTNKSAILFSGSVSAQIGVLKNFYFITSVGENDQLKGVPYFWYPVSKSRIDFQLKYYSNILSFSLLKIPESQICINISFRKYLK
jgi:hypothetical protein